MDKRILLSIAVMLMPILALGFSNRGLTAFQGVGGLETGIILVAFTAVVARIATRAVIRIMATSVMRIVSRGFARLFMSSIAKNDMKVESSILEVQGISFFLCWLSLGLSLALFAYLKYGVFYELSFLFVFIPLFVYVLAQKAVANILKVKHLLLCPFDAILVQFYFAGAVSFLPLSNESRLHGNRQQNGLIGLAGSCALLLLALALRIPKLPDIEVLRSICLLFLLISAFPIKPMDGSYIWGWSKPVSLIVFLIAIEFTALLGGEFLAGMV